MMMDGATLFDDGRDVLMNFDEEALTIFIFEDLSGRSASQCTELKQNKLPSRTANLASQRTECSTFCI